MIYEASQAMIDIARKEREAESAYLIRKQLLAYAEPSTSVYKAKLRACNIAKMQLIAVHEALYRECENTLAFVDAARNALAQSGLPGSEG